MMERIRRPVAAWSAAALLVLLGSPPSPAASPAGGLIEGSLTAPDGKPASGWRIVLLSPEGDLVARRMVSPRGTYRFDDVPAGPYALAAEDREGRLAPVVGPPARVASGRATRRDVRLVPGDGGSHLAQTVFGPRGDSWWSRQTRNQKILAIAGIAVGAGIVLAVVQNLTEDDEKPASGYR